MIAEVRIPKKIFPPVPSHGLAPVKLDPGKAHTLLSSHFLAPISGLLLPFVTFA